MAKTLTLKHTGYWVEGTARILCWDGEESDVNMDPFHARSLDEIPDRINDGQFGCQAILKAECLVYEVYGGGTHVFLETRSYSRDEIGMNAPRGVKEKVA